MNESQLAPNLTAILDDLLPAAGRLAARRRRRARYRRTGALAVLGVVLASSAAVGAYSLLGSAAPPSVVRDLRSVDRGMPRDLRLNPDVAQARAVAVSPDSVVYFAPLTGGGYCAELVTRGAGGRGAVCSTDPSPSGISVTIPFTDPVRPDSPVTVSGRVADPRARSVQLVYADGGSESVAVQRAGFYVADVAADHLAAVHRHGLMLVARGADGEPLGQAVAPSDAITPPSESDRPHDPIELDTVSTEADFTQVLRVRGRLYIRGVDHVTLKYADGSTVGLPLDGERFDYAVPAERRHDLMQPGTVTAWSGGGKVLAQRPVAAVAYWHAANSGGG